MSAPRTALRLALVAVLAGAACVAPPPPGTSQVPSTLRDEPTVPEDPTGTATRAMVRVRALACDGLAVGSGFAIDEHTIVTNRHVVVGADRITLDTWDGHELEVRATRVSAAHDLAVVEVTEALATTITLARTPATTGDVVHVIGYPFGRALTTETGTVTQIRGTADEDAETAGAIVFAAEVHHGNSGGPLLDENGEATGVVYRKVVGDGDGDAGLALPSSVVRSDLAEDAFIDNPDCATARERFGDR